MSLTKPPALAHQFDDLRQQREADTLGMWVFLATELLLFGGLFLAYAVYRSLYPEAWAEGSHHNNLVIGTINTAILLVSSLTMALAVHAAEREAWRPAAGFLLATVGLGVVFLGLKFYEYYEHYLHGAVPGVHFTLPGPEAPHVALFFVFYFAMTGLHALHMLIGAGLVTTVAVLAWRRRLTHHMPVEITGLYWHLIDIIWVFLYPLLYLIG
jgi:cytochrome c oxidase subunit 3